MLDAALSTGLSSDQFWDMTFRELAGHHKAVERKRMGEWDRATWMVLQLLQPHLGDGNRIDYYELHPYRDAAQHRKKDEFGSDEEIQAFMNSQLAKHKPTDE